MHHLQLSALPYSIHSVFEDFLSGYAPGLDLLGNSWLGRRPTAIKAHSGIMSYCTFQWIQQEQPPVDSVVPHPIDTLITAAKRHPWLMGLWMNIILREWCTLQHNQFQECTSRCHFNVTNNKWTLGEAGNVTDLSFWGLLMAPNSHQKDSWMFLCFPLKMGMQWKL